MNLLGIKIAYADVETLIGNINQYIVNPFIVLLFAVALVYFLFGVFKFLSNSDSSDEREKGKQHMLWGIVGMFIMMAVFTIMHILANTLGSTVQFQK